MLFLLNPATPFELRTHFYFTDEEYETKKGSQERRKETPEKESSMKSAEGPGAQNQTGDSGTVPSVGLASCTRSREGVSGHLLALAGLL